MDWFDEDKFLNVAQVIAPDGTVLGYQSKPVRSVGRQYLAGRHKAQAF